MDLSETGLSLRLARLQSLPRHMDVVITSHEGRSVTVRARLVRSEMQQDQVIAAIRFVDRTPEQHRRVIELMYSAPDSWDVEHGLAMDSQGRLFVADRGNNRIQIFDQDGKFIAEWKQFGRPSGIFIDKNDLLYVADSQSGPEENPGFKQGIRVGSAKDGKVISFIEETQNLGSLEGTAADAAGNVYAGYTGAMNFRRFSK